MKNLTVFKKKKALAISIGIGLIIMVVVILLTSNLIERSQQKEFQSITVEYIGLQDQINNLISSNIILLQGYTAYIKASDEVNEEKTLEYLEALTQPYKEYIRNIAIIKDTTIIYNYPKEGNEATIGVDLSQIEGQKEVVQKTKKLMTPIFQGPIELVQGGRAFVIRLPFSDENDVYWGQISIVLKADVVLSEIARFASERDLEIAIRSNDEGLSWIFGDEQIYEKKPLEFKIQTNLINWRLYVLPKDGWVDRRVTIFTSIVLSLLAFVLFGNMAYFAQKANYQVKHNSLHDQLTGLYNRHYFDEYQAVIVGASERNDEAYGLVLIDLDDFKAINDTYGHKVGDLVLVETARLLRDVSRSNESVFRLGGDEFMITIPRLVHDEELRVIKDRIEKAFYKAFNVDGYDLAIYPSVGTASYPENGLEFDEVMHSADKHMYEEKELSKVK